MESVVPILLNKAAFGGRIRYMGIAHKIAAVAAAVSMFASTAAFASTTRAASAIPVASTSAVSSSPALYTRASTKQRGANGLAGLSIIPFLIAAAVVATVTVVAIDDNNDSPG